MSNLCKSHFPAFINSKTLWESCTEEHKKVTFYNKTISSIFYDPSRVCLLLWVSWWQIKEVRGGKSEGRAWHHQPIFSSVQDRVFLKKNQLPSLSQVKFWELTQQMNMVSTYCELSKETERLLSKLLTGLLSLSPLGQALALSSV